jgi:hypothetical protein
MGGDAGCSQALSPTAAKAASVLRGAVTNSRSDPVHSNSSWRVYLLEARAPVVLWEYGVLREGRVGAGAASCCELCAYGVLRDAAECAGAALCCELCEYGLLRAAAGGAWVALCCVLWEYGVLRDCARGAGAALRCTRVSAAHELLLCAREDEDREAAVAAWVPCVEEYGVLRECVSCGPLAPRRLRRAL